MRIAVLSAHPQYTTGYGGQTASLLARLAELPAVGGRSNVAVAAIGVEGADHTADGYRVFPLGQGIPSGCTTDAAIIAGRLRPYCPDVVISLYDVRAFPGVGRSLPGLGRTLRPARWVPWVPVDCDPISNRDVAALDGCHIPVAMSKFGRAQLLAAGVRDAVYIPLGIESVFAVNPDVAEVKRARAAMFGADCEHLTVICAQNHDTLFTDRKSYQTQLRAWATFAQDKPGARLYCHCEPVGPRGAINLHDLTHALDIADRVFFPLNLQTLQGVPVATMAEIYNIADVLLGATTGEGFGLPIVEAQACGVPVVVTAFSAMPELVRWGEAVEPLDRQWVPELRSWRAWPDVRGTAAAVERLYNEWHAAGCMWPMAKREQVSQCIHSEYGWDGVFARHWTPLLQGMN